MSLAELSCLIESPSERLGSINKLIAFVGRYGSCGPGEAKQMTSLELSEYARAVGELLEEENRPRQ